MMVMGDGFGRRLFVCRHGFAMWSVMWYNNSGGV
jgi:hypothetical protein